MTKAYKSLEIGFAHGNSAAGTGGYKPGNRTRPDTLGSYNSGFQLGMSHYHERSRSQRDKDAWRNQPKATRGERTE